MYETTGYTCEGKDNGQFKNNKYHNFSIESKTWDAFLKREGKGIFKSRKNYGKNDYNLYCISCHKHGDSKNGVTNNFVQGITKTLAELQDESQFTRNIQRTYVKHLQESRDHYNNEQKENLVKQHEMSGLLIRADIAYSMALYPTTMAVFEGYCALLERHGVHIGPKLTGKEIGARFRDILSLYLNIQLRYNVTAYSISSYNITFIGGSMDGIDIIPVKFTIGGILSGDDECLKCYFTTLFQFEYDSDNKVKNIESQVQAFANRLKVLKIYPTDFSNVNSIYDLIATDTPIIIFLGFAVDGPYLHELDDQSGKPKIDTLVKQYFPSTPFLRPCVWDRQHQRDRGWKTAISKTTFEVQMKLTQKGVVALREPKKWNWNKNLRKDNWQQDRQ